MRKPANADHPVHDLIRERWSPVAFATRPVPRDLLLSVFEAARWAPSSFNEQPWRFVVGDRESDPETHRKIAEVLLPKNRAWAESAPVLALGIAKTHFAHNDKPNRFALYDTGQAVASLIVQATALGLHVHQMGGYDVERAHDIFALPEGYVTASAFALGYVGDPDELEDETLRAKHTSPERKRLPLGDLLLSGAGDAFGAPAPLARTP